MGKGEETHLAEEFVVVRSTHSISSRANVWRRYSSCGNCGRSPLPNRQALDSSKKANTPRAVPGSSACVILSGRVIDSLKLISEQHTAIFLYDLVDDEHDQLAQCRCRRGRYHSGPTWRDLLFIKQINTVAAGFPAYTNYLYSTYNAVDFRTAR
jgi:hypothetical protein